MKNHEKSWKKQKIFFWKNFSSGHPPRHSRAPRSVRNTHFNRITRCESPHVSHEILNSGDQVTERSGNFQKMKGKLWISPEIGSGASHRALGSPVNVQEWVLKVAQQVCMAYYVKRGVNSANRITWEHQENDCGAKGITVEAINCAMTVSVPIHVVYNTCMYSLVFADWFGN